MFDIKTIVELIKRLLIAIFRNFEVDKEFEALGVDIEDVINSITLGEE